MKKEFLNLLACPKCKSKLIISKNKITCQKCKSKYFLSGNIPIFLQKKLKSETKAIGAFRAGHKTSLSKIHSQIRPPDTSFTKKINVFNTKVDYPLKSLLQKNKLTLNIGSSSKKVYPNTINLDIGNFENVDVVADGKNLPFKNNSFDLVLIESVLEHVNEPEKVIKEAYRVLKKSGKVYISIPFVFVFHGSPDDFNRYTLNGLIQRLKLSGFKIEKYGILSGPSSTMSQMLRYYLALLFSFNSDFLFSFFLNFFGWLTFPIKYLDVLVRKNKKSYVMANIIYATGKKI